MIRVKICGLTRLEDLQNAIKAGAGYVGFVFFERSPRFVTHDEARKLALEVPAGVIKTGLFVDPDDAFLEAVLEKVPLDMIQLHGEEAPERVAAIRARFGLPVMKVIGISSADDLAKLSQYDAADQFLLDAKAPEGSTRPGGHGTPFDWSILSGLKLQKPWMLAGGLNAENLREAVRISGARQVDLSSGVESAPGIKDKALMEAFLDEAKKAL